MTVKECLRRVHVLDEAVNTAMKQIASLESDAERTTQIYGKVLTDGGTNGDYDRAIRRLIESKKKCNAINDEYIAYKALILDRINMLSDAEHRKILTAVYISRNKHGKPLTWDEIALQVSYSARQAQRIHGDALHEFRKVMPTDEDVARCRSMSPGDMV